MAANMISAQPSASSIGRNGSAGVFVVAALYAFVAAGPILFYALIRNDGYLSASELATLAPGTLYASARAIYFGSAAVASVLLCARRRLAVWPAITIVAWTGGGQVYKWFEGRQVRLVDVAISAGFAGLAWHVLRLRRRGLLR
jgi:hypothetical protein